MGRISGPLLDRFDLRIDVPAVSMRDLTTAPTGQPSRTVAARVAAARQAQDDRYRDHPEVRVNADAEGSLLLKVARPDPKGQAILNAATDRLGLSARGYHRTMRTARTIADLDGSDAVTADHVAEAVSYRLAQPGDASPRVTPMPSRKSEIRLSA